MNGPDFAYVFPEDPEEFQALLSRSKKRLEELQSKLSLTPGERGELELLVCKVQTLEERHPDNQKEDA